MEGLSQEALAPTVRDPDRVGDPFTLRHWLTVAPKNGAIMAGRKGPAMWLRYGLLLAGRGQL